MSINPKFYNIYTLRNTVSLVSQIILTSYAHVDLHQHTRMFEVSGKLHSMSDYPVECKMELLLLEKC